MFIPNIYKYKADSTSDSYNSMIPWLIPVIFDEIPNRGGPLVQGRGGTTYNKRHHKKFVLIAYFYFKMMFSQTVQDCADIQYY